MFRNGLLVLTSSCLKTKISSILRQVSKEVREVLYVDIYEPENPHDQLGALYVLLLEIFSNNSSTIGPLDVRVLLPRALAKNSVFREGVRHLSNEPEAAFVRDIFRNQSTDCLFGFKKWMCDRFQLTELDKRLKFLEEEEDMKEEIVKERARKICSPSVHAYNDIVVGGTFDHLHSGHRLLLSVTSLLSQQRITIGLSEGPLLQRKVLKEFIEPFSVRKRNLEEFIDDIKPGLKLNIIPLIDPIGPVGTEETYQCLVVTKETKRGGSMINSIREEGGLKPVDVHVVDLVLDDDFASAPEKGDNEHKLSSTAERQKLLGNLLRPVVQKENIVGRPYVIGVTGGIACGKSSVCQRLKGLGAAIINCDQLGHCAYAPGKKAYKEIIANFGPDVLTPEKTINRKALGSIVFADNSKLALLNQIVWPEILVQVESEISRHGQAGFKVCVLDAAILLEAGWDKVTNEVWVVFVPEAEALSRILSRDGLTEKQALNRIRSQLGNEERLAKANVAICTLWEPECTQQQVEKAWTRLQKTVQ